MQNENKDSSVLTVDILMKMYRWMRFVANYGFDPDKPISFEKNGQQYIAVVSEDYTEFFYAAVVEPKIEFKIDIEHHRYLKEHEWIRIYQGGWR